MLANNIFESDNKCAGFKDNTLKIKQLLVLMYCEY